MAWNLVAGVNDPPTGSERTVWIDGEPARGRPSDVLRRPDRASTGCGSALETVRERRDNLLLVRSSYRQPFGTFSGKLPVASALAEGYGVMEAHDAWW